MDNGILCLNKKRRYQISKHCIISTMVSSWYLLNLQKKTGFIPNVSFYFPSPKKKKRNTKRKDKNIRLIKIKQCKMKDIFMNIQANSFKIKDMQGSFNKDYW
jgi:hypothetical protein